LCATWAIVKHTSSRIKRLNTRLNKEVKSKLDTLTDFYETYLIVTFTA